MTSLGTSGVVDGSVMSIGTIYDDMGRVEFTTSYPNDDGTGTPVNQVEDAYDGWGNLIQEWQSHDGAVDTETTPSVQYTYADGAVDGVAAYMRLTDVTDPTNTQAVGYYYGATGSTDDVLSRVEAVTDGTGINAPHLAEYSYLGLNTIVKTAHPQVAGGLNLNYDPGGDNTYTGFDRFGRVADQLWADDSGNVLDEYKYGYDAAGNVLWKQNVVSENQQSPVYLDELYTYNDLDELTDRKRGANSTPPTIKSCRARKTFCRTGRSTAWGISARLTTTARRRPARRTRPTRSFPPAASPRRPTTRPAT